MPYIDACMRELRQSGWLAYKGRKTVGHFLVFALGVDWRIGAFYFEEVLLDYDCAMNYGNWITVARVDKPSVGSDHATETLSELVEANRSDIELKLSAEMANDPSGEYVRQWVSELRDVDDQYVHAPWSMPLEVARACGCVPGKDYPAPLVGPLCLSVAIDAELFEEMEHETDPSVERRSHPQSKSKRAYTHQEFIVFALSIGETELYGEKLWNEAFPHHRRKSSPSQEPALEDSNATTA